MSKVKPETETDYFMLVIWGLLRRFCGPIQDLSELAGKRLHVKVHDPQRFCWSVLTRVKVDGLLISFAIFTKKFKFENLSILRSICT